MSKSHRVSSSHRRTQAHISRRNLMAGLETLEPRLPLAASVTPPTTTAIPNGAFYNDAIMVRFNPGVSDANAAQVVNSIGGTVAKSYGGSLAGLKEITLPATAQNSQGVWNAMATVHASSYVKYVEPNYVHTYDAIPNDTQFGQLWGLNNAGQAGGVPDADIDAAEAWDTTTGSKNVVVAVLDSGIDATHPDLAPNLWSNPGEIAGDGIDNDGNGYIDDTYGWDVFNNDAVPNDDVAHGTHVAGTIGAAGNNALGVAGVNWNVSLMVLKVGGTAGIPTTAIIEAVDYVTTMRQRGINVVVSNNSYGGYSFSQAEHDAIAANNAAGVLFVAAAGNDANNNDGLAAYPASYDLPNIIAVAATDRRDAMSGFSNYGATTVDLGAPGEEILSTVPAFEDPSGYAVFDGTSMASPHVAGAVGLLASAAPGATAQDLKSYILQGVEQLPSLAGRTLTGGRLNINNSLNLIPKSFVQGHVFTDKLGDGIIQANDTVLAGITVYNDANNNGLLDSGELSAVTDAAGFYNIGPITTVQGAATIRLVLPPFYSITTPQSGSHSIVFAFNGEVRTGVDFGLYGQPGEIRGHKWMDFNGNASLNPEQGDGPLGGIFIYVDIDNDGRPGMGEPAAVTANDGSYVIKNVPVGTYALREVLTPGTATAFPATNGGAHIITMTPKGVLTGFDFFNSPAYDYGDAPDSYQTTLASGGPVHGYKAGFQLGDRLDADADGNPTAWAMGDDNTFSDDEDGVRFFNISSPGNVTNFEVKVNVPAFTPNGYLHAWMDFNRDGDFNDAGEKILSGLRLGTGTYTFSANVPANAVIGPTFARFRYGTEATLGPGGRSQAGEVEDYRLDILPSKPIAVDDGDAPPLDAQTPDIAVLEASVDNRIDVLANDIRSARSRVQIVAAPFAGAGLATDLGGTVTIDDNGTPTNPFDDVLLYDAAPPPASSAGKTFYVDHFTYTISDGVNTDTADVWVTVNKLSTPPTAVDDTFDARPNTATSKNTAIMNVLGNDLGGTVQGIATNRKILVSFDTQVFNADGDLIGTVTRDQRGTWYDKTDDRLIFKAAPGVNNTTGQFTYTINNPQDLDPSLRQSATVTVQIRDRMMQPDANDEIALSIQVYTDGVNGTPDVRVDSGTGPFNIVEKGEYWVGIFARDLRGDVTTVGGGEANGAFSVFADLLYDAHFMDVVRVPVTPDNPLGIALYSPNPYNFTASPQSNVDTPGLINELGATALSAPGDGNKDVIYVKFKIKDLPNNQLPTNGNPFWRLDPADFRSDVDPSFGNDIQVTDEVDPTLVRSVLPENVAYLHSQNFRIQAAASPTLASSSVASSSVGSSPIAPVSPISPLKTTSTSGTASSTTTTSTSGGGLSQAELMAYYGNQSLGNVTSSSSRTVSVSHKATDAAITSLFDDLLVNNKK